MPERKRRRSKYVIFVHVPGVPEFGVKEQQYCIPDYYTRGKKRAMKAALSWANSFSSDRRNVTITITEEYVYERVR